MHATVGLRYDVRRTEGEKRDIGIDISDEIKDAEVLPKFSLGYDLTDTAYGYATVSKGYLAGGYNYGLATDKDSFAYDPEYTWNYEIGFKTDWLERRLQVNLALFYIQMTDKQVFEMSGGSYPTTRVDNAAKALSKGVELELKARPARGWDIFAGLGYVDAEYDDWTATEWNSTYTALTRNDYSGKTLPNVPEYTGSLGIQYRHASGLFARADVSAVGPLYADQNNYFEEDAYGLVDLQLGYETEKFDIVLWGKNVFDTGYHTIAYDWNGEKLVQDGEPAMVGVRATLRF
jgi:iron complex outermembrane receptor protein